MRLSIVSHLCCDCDCDNCDFNPRRMDADTLECLGILEQGTAACWGSLAVIDRCGVGLIQLSFVVRALAVSLITTRTPESRVQTSSRIPCLLSRGSLAFLICPAVACVVPTPTPTPLPPCQGVHQGLQSRRYLCLAGSRPCWPWQSFPARIGYRRGLYFAR